MKALEVLKNINVWGYTEEVQQQIDEAIKELEELENKSCNGCKHHLSQDGNYPLEPCWECERWYSDMFEQKDKK